MKKYKIYQFGAGNIGKGLVAELLKKNNNKINFIDQNEELINKLKNKPFTIKYLNTNKIIQMRANHVLNAKNKNEIINHLKNADYITTAIGVANFKYIVPILVNVIKNRTLNNPLIILACENSFKASENLCKLIQINLKNAQKNKIAFINLVVDRIVPNALNQLVVEDFFNVFYEKNQHQFPFNEINTKSQKIIGVNNYEQYYYLKILGVNGLHCILAFLSLKNKFLYVNEVIKINNYKNLILQIINELTQAISGITKINIIEVNLYLLKNLERFINPKLIDSNKRILRNLKTKLKPNERLFPIKQYLEENNLDTALFIKIFNEMLNFANQLIN